MGKFESFSITKFESEAPEAVDPGVVPAYGKVPAACRYAGGVSERTMWTWLGQGLPHVRVNGTTLIKFTDLDEWLGQHRVERDKVKDIVDPIVRKHRNG